MLGGCMGVAVDERGPLQSSRKYDLKAAADLRRRRSPHRGRVHDGPVETFVVDRRLPENF